LSFIEDSDNVFFRNVNVSGGQYRVTIPKSLAKVMDLSNKDTVKIVYENDKLILSKM